MPHEATTCAFSKSHAVDLAADRTWPNPSRSEYAQGCARQKATARRSRGKIDLANAISVEPNEDRVACGHA